MEPQRDSFNVTHRNRSDFHIHCELDLYRSLILGWLGNGLGSLQSLDPAFDAGEGMAVRDDGAFDSTTNRTDDSFRHDLTEIEYIGGTGEVKMGHLGNSTPPS